MTIDELQKKLDHWRKNKKSHLDRIPQEYWEAAIKFAENSSPSTIATKLNLNVWDLKKRMGIPIKSEKKIFFKELPVQTIEKKTHFRADHNFLSLENKLPDYSNFCRQVNHHLERRAPDPKIMIKIFRQPGHSLEVDYSGNSLEIINPVTGEITKVELFVGALT